MQYVGIVAEYNPFHLGHQHQITMTKQKIGDPTTIIAVMSGNWVQQADCAIADKWSRAKLALQGGVDLILELPTPWSTASAERFCHGGISILEGTGMVNYLSFGSECGNLAPLQTIAQTLESEEFSTLLKQNLKEGQSFATTRQTTVTQLIGATGEHLRSPNNTLGLEYLRSLLKLGSSIKPITILREGAQHNSTIKENSLSPYTSASDLRAHIKVGDLSHLDRYGLPDSRNLFAEATPSLAQCERAILAKLSTFTVDQWSQLPDSGVGEGLPSRLVRAGQQATSVAQFLDLAKTKRYTHARLRRLVLWSFLSLTTDKCPETVPYLKVLGFNQKGADALKLMKTHATLPILTKPAQALKIGGKTLKLMEEERVYTDLYGMCFPEIRTKGQEWLRGPIITQSENFSS